MILYTAIPSQIPPVRETPPKGKKDSHTPNPPPQKLQEEKQTSQRIKGEIVHQGMNPFFQWMNGKLTPRNPENPTLFESTSGYLQSITKTLWTTTPIIQAFGLVSKRANMFARAVYGTCWAVVYSCLRPFKADAELLTDEGATKPISDTVKSFDRANEHFRVGMGSIVTAIYGGGALGMLWNAITGNEEGFESASNIYQKGMLDQNQIFASMNTSICMKRKYNENQLGEEDKRTGNIKSKAEFIDSVLFLPTVLTRGIDTFKFLGGNIGEGLEKIVNSFGYFSYGTWAARFGFIKEQEFKGAGALEPKNDNLTGTAKSIDDALYNTQKYSAKAFWTTLPVLSFLSSGLEIFGMGELAKKVFSFEGVIERLLPTISAWCLRDPVLSGLIKKPDVKPVQSAQAPDIQSADVAAEIETASKSPNQIAPIPTNDVTIKEKPVEMPAQRVTNAKRFLIGKLEKNREVVEDIFLAAKLGLIKWDAIIGACIKGTVTLNMVQSHMNYFTDERVLDRALEEAHITTWGGRRKNETPIIDETPPTLLIFPGVEKAEAKPLNFNEEINSRILEFTQTGNLAKDVTIEHIIESAKQGFIKWQAAFKGFSLNKDQAVWELFLDKIVDESIPLSKLKENRLVFAEPKNETVDNSLDAKDYNTDTPQYFDLADVVYIKYHEVLDNPWGIAV